MAPRSYSFENYTTLTVTFNLDQPSIVHFVYNVDLRSNIIEHILVQNDFCTNNFLSFVALNFLLINIHPTKYYHRNRKCLHGFMIFFWEGVCGGGALKMHSALMK